MPVTVVFHLKKYSNSLYNNKSEVLSGAIIHRPDAPWPIWCGQQLCDLLLYIYWPDEAHNLFNSHTPVIYDNKPIHNNIIWYPICPEVYFRWRWNVKMLWPVIVQALQSYKTLIILFYILLLCSLYALTNSNCRLTDDNGPWSFYTPS